MNPALAAALYCITWWLCFFVVLPIGVRPVDEAASTQGHDSGAPAAPDLGRKALWAAGGAVVVWGIMMVVLHFTYYSR